MQAPVLLVTLIGTTFASGQPNITSLLETNSFVDKSQLVYILFHSSSTIIVTAPPRFGKTTNLELIKRFCEITVDDAGNRVPQNETENYQMFSAYKLVIYHHYKSFFHDNFGAFPVVYLDFKQLNCMNYTLFISTLENVVHDAFNEHKYLLKSVKLGEEHYNKFKKRLKISEIEVDELFDSVKLLTELLYLHFDDSKCIVLIDDYDAPVREAIHNSGTDLRAIVDFINQFVSISLNGNDYVNRTLITACMVVTSGVPLLDDTVEHVHFLEDLIHTGFYGFSLYEVRNLLARQNLLEQLDHVQEYYCGYYAIHSRVKLYNPHSIAEYIKHKQFRNYWMQPEDFYHVANALLTPPIRVKLQELFCNDFLKISISDTIDVNAIIKLKKIVRNKEPGFVDTLTSADVDLFLQFMMKEGYFNIEYRYIEKDATFAYITVPNREISQAINNTIKIITQTKSLTKLKEDKDLH